MAGQYPEVSFFARHGNARDRVAHHQAVRAHDIQFQNFRESFAHNLNYAAFSFSAFSSASSMVPIM